MIASQDRALTLIAFLAFIVLSLLLCVLAGPETDETADFYTGNRSLTPVQNALALAGDYISAATLLGSCGLVALFGYDGIAAAVSTCLAVGGFLLLARPLHHTGRYTLGDILALRAPGPAARIAAAVATLAFCVPFLVVQLTGAGQATALLIGLTEPAAQQVCTVFIGAVMICYAALGGMKGTSLVQILKVAVVFTTMAVLALMVLAHYDWSVNALLDAAARGSGRGDAYYESGQALGESPGGRLDFLGLQLSIVLGGACMPHIVMRVNSAADGAAARRTTRHTVVLIAVYSVFIVIAGLGAAGVVGDSAIRAADPNGQASLMLLAKALGGDTSALAGNVLFTAVACTIFVSVLAVVAGITLTAAAALAHDVHAQVVRRGRLSEGGEIASARWAAVAVGVLGILLAVALQGGNLQSLIQLSLTASGASILPACLYSLFWGRFNRTGLLWTVYGGLAATLAVYMSSTAFSGTPTSLLPGADIHWITLQSTGLIAIPAGFLLGWTGSRLGRRGSVADGARGERAWRTRVLTGVDAE
ncbi:cation acetate symporter [Streptomyces sp. SID13726]|uniref:sodium:solute symporter family transporter n=1 Tax=Streptomyces sp. SID13726 TaxID=2706058 RepID=UPI0013BE7105|nr:cation acetate symporter [Streptomyces sp. SID13726]